MPGFTSSKIRGFWSIRPASYVVLGACLVSIYGFDRLVASIWGELTFAPFLAVTFFGLLVLRGEPLLILLAIPLFALESFFLIDKISQFPLVRSSTVAFAGIIAFFACLQGWRASFRSAALESLLYALPTPWMLTNGEGEIVKCGKISPEIIATDFSENKKSSIFSVFRHQEGGAVFIGRFLDVLQGNMAPLVLDCFTTSGIPVRVTLIPFIFESKKAVLAIPRL